MNAQVFFEVVFVLEGLATLLAFELPGLRALVRADGILQHQGKVITNMSIHTFLFVVPSHVTVIRFLY